MSVTIKDITATQTTLNADDYFELQENGGTSKKVQWSVMSAGTGLYVGQSMQIFYSYKPIAPAFPWLCMSLPDATLSTSNYSSGFIDELRSRKIVYDEFNTAVSSFGGAWAGSNYTLTNNAENVAMIAELYEDWLFAGSPASGWRILVSNGVEYNITGFTVASRIITVSGSPAGTSIEIYLNRILGSTTSAKHFSWAGLGLYMTGQNKITGLRRRDAIINHNHGTFVKYASGTVNYGEGATANSDASALGTISVSTRNKTEIESATAMLYLYAGSFV